MKNRIGIFALLLVCALMIFPLSAWAAGEPASETDEAAEGEIVVIEDEEVPLAAIPMSFLDGSNNSVRPEVFVITGASLMACACVGFVIKLQRHRREEK